jgi:hypothetical protein
MYHARIARRLLGGLLQDARTTSFVGLPIGRQTRMHFTLYHRTMMMWSFALTNLYVETVDHQAMHLVIVNVDWVHSFCDLYLFTIL